MRTRPHLSLHAIPTTAHLLSHAGPAILESFVTQVLTSQPGARANPKETSATHPPQDHA